MSRAKSKDELLQFSVDHFEKLYYTIDHMTDYELSQPFDFSSDKKKKEAHWNRDKNVRDVLIHLYEWHKLQIEWIKFNQQGIEKSFLPEPYNWRFYGELNVLFWKKHQDTTLDQAKKLLKNTHEKMMDLVKSFSNEELFLSTPFVWTKGTKLGSYFVSNMSSHYQWAIDKIIFHIKLCNIL